MLLGLGCTLHSPERFQQWLVPGFHPPRISVVLGAGCSIPANTREGQNTVPLGMPNSPIGSVCSFSGPPPVKPDMTSWGGSGVGYAILTPFEHLDQRFSIMAACSSPLGSFSTHQCHSLTPRDSDFIGLAWGPALEAENYRFQRNIMCYLKPTVKFRNSGSPISSLLHTPGNNGLQKACL